MQTSALTKDEENSDPLPTLPFADLNEDEVELETNEAMTRTPEQDTD